MSLKADTTSQKQDSFKRTYHDRASIEESAQQAVLAIAAHLAGTGIISPESLIELLHNAAASCEWTSLTKAARYVFAHSGTVLHTEPYATDVRTFLEVCAHLMHVSAVRG